MRPYDPVKRVIDVVVAAAVLMLSLPAQLVIGLLVLRNLGRPIFFRQERPGCNGTVFTLVKFRTMRAPDPQARFVTDQQRLTRFGQRLRSSSLDELPTLWNVLRGSMSLVGPRPLLVQYLGRYTPEQSRRHEVRPGITGLAQISGRNELSWTEKFRIDVEYVDRRSARLDAMILLRTPLSVLQRRGITAAGHATTPEFSGSGILIEGRL
jgi:lipopolysaccharide/colanic/teichoic acid biosynthesis glycosyltransferase